MNTLPVIVPLLFEIDALTLMTNDRKLVAVVSPWTTSSIAWMRRSSSL
jgi:hypothetical protein